MYYVVRITYYVLHITYYVLRITYYVLRIHITAEKVQAPDVSVFFLFFTEPGGKIC